MVIIECILSMEDFKKDLKCLFFEILLVNFFGLDFVEMVEIDDILRSN